jgi:hypothetical protein
MSDRQWYYVAAGRQVGPIAEADLVIMFQKGQLGPDTQVWTAELKNWTRAAEVEGLISTALSPLSTLQTSGTSLAQARPTSVTVFGILNIVFGAIGILATPLEIIMMFVRPRTMNLSEGVRVWLMLSSVIGLARVVLLIVTGIGLLKLKPWARVWTLGYGLFAICYNILGMIVNIIFMSTGGYGFSPDEMPGLIVGLIGGFCGGIVGLIYPILLVVFMRREDVIQAFKR